MSAYPCCDTQEPGPRSHTGVNTLRHEKNVTDGKIQFYETVSLKLLCENVFKYYSSHMRKTF